MRVWSECPCWKMSCCLHLINESPLLTGAGIEGHGEKNWYKPKRFSCYGWTSAEPPGASWEMGTKTQAASEKALEETATATRYERRVSAKGQEEALISLYNRISSFLIFRLFFQCEHVHGCFRSHTSKRLAPGLNLLLCAPFHHPTKQFSKRKAANYQIELFIEFQLTSQI